MKRHIGTISTGILLALGLVLSACGTVTLSPTSQPTSTTAPTETPVPTDEATISSPLPTPAPEGYSPIATPEAISPIATPETPAEDDLAEATVEWKADGTITEGEYSAYADFNDMRLWWDHDGEFLYIAMEGDTNGWISVGINPENRMQGANYLFGYVADGIDRLWDAYGTAPTGANHPADNELGGTNDIVTYSGAEVDGVTRFEIQIPLDSGDDYDQPLAPGNSYPLIIAIGDEDSFNAYHTRYDQGELTLAP